VVKEVVCPGLRVAGTDKPAMLKPVPRSAGCGNRYAGRAELLKRDGLRSAAPHLYISKIEG